jgi:hypothetical protein
VFTTPVTDGEAFQVGKMEGAKVTRFLRLGPLFEDAPISNRIEVGHDCKYQGTRPVQEKAAKVSKVPVRSSR